FAEARASEQRQHRQPERCLSFTASGSRGFTVYRRVEDQPQFVKLERCSFAFVYVDPNVSEGIRPFVGHKVFATCPSGDRLYTTNQLGDRSRRALLRANELVAPLGEFCKSGGA